MKQLNMHTFAFFVPALSTQLKNAHIHDTYILEHKDVITRITSIVRLKPDESCILFDRVMHIMATLEAENKKTITFRINTIEKNKELKPEIICLLPLLKKDDLAEAINDLTACGVTKIQLITTAKVQRTWGGPQELQRLERIAIAAAEQSKHYTYPLIYEPISLQKAITTYNTTMRIFFDPSGNSLPRLISSLTGSISSISLLVGPEGDLTSEEKKYLKEKSIIFCALTPTILRAHLAITVGAAFIRSLS